MKRALQIALSLGLLAIGLLTFAIPIIAQENGEAEKSGFIRFVEGQLSAPGRQISINGLDGALSSDVAIAEITISDEKGVWLRIENARLNWNQGALLTGRLQINQLAADRIDYLRPAVSPETMAPPSPEARPLEVPDLPIAIILDELVVPRVTFGKEIFGLGSEISVEGNLRLEGGALATSLDILRLDGPGGSLTLDVGYDNETTELALAVDLLEPSGGLVANLLNIDGRPELRLAIEGNGPIRDLTARLSLVAGGETALSGTVRLADAPEGLAIATVLGGPIATLMAPDFRPFFGRETRLQAEAVLRDSGAINVQSLKIDGGQLLVQGNAATAPDGFLKSLQLDIAIAARNAQTVTLPVPGAATKISSARANIDFGQDERWTGTIEVEQLDTGGFEADLVRLDLSGAALNLSDPASRRLTFNADGTVSGIHTDDPGMDDALGTNIGLGLAGLWNAGQPLRIAEARLEGRSLELALDGSVEEFVFDGQIALRTPSLAPFSGIARRQLSGGTDLTATGKLQLLSGGFDLSLQGSANNLVLDIPALDPVLQGSTNLSGRIARNEQGVTAEQFQIANEQARILADGTFSSTSADFDFVLGFADLSLVSPRASGPLTVNGSAKGADSVIDLSLVARIPSGELVDRQLREAEFRFAGKLAEGDLTGVLDGNAFLAGFRVALNAGIVANDNNTELTSLVIEAGPTRLEGNIARSGEGLLTGDLSLQSNDISTAAALLLAEASGSANADLQLKAENGEQAAQILVQTRTLVFNEIVVGSADIDATLRDLFGVPKFDGSIVATDLNAAGLEVARLDARASNKGDKTGFAAEATLENNTILDLDGSLEEITGGYEIEIQSANLEQNGLRATLARPAKLTYAGQSIAFADTQINIGAGSITAIGSAGEALDIRLNLQSVPLSIANAVQPELGLGGTLNGIASVSGAPSGPKIIFELIGNGIDANAISGYGLTPLRVAASGQFAENQLTLSAAQAGGPNGLQATASGLLPLVGRNGKLAINASLPLAIAGRTIGTRGTQLSGTVNIAANVTGSLTKPQFSGTISATKAEIVDPPTNLRLQNISAAARLSGGELVIENISGDLATGGSISASGTVSISDPALPADISIVLNAARYADGNLFVATASGNLALTGPLLNGPVLGGELQISRAEISIPDAGGGSAALIDVSHLAPPPDVAATLRRARIDETGGDSATTGGDLRLDIVLAAPSQIFVRGRGVDAELGGRVRLTGPLSDIQPVGGFELIRGRLSILGQRITFISGRVTLIGDLDPYIDFAARTAAENATVLVTMSGPVSDLKITFSSQPELPQDEVLSLLIFKRSVGDLSPLQLAKLAAAAAELAGGGGNSLTDSLRQSTGLDDLDITTDDSGNAAVQAGRYIQDNVYLGVQAGADGESKVTIDLDLTDTLKARGATGTDGETSLGIFYEEDY